VTVVRTWNNPVSPVVCCPKVWVPRTTNNVPGPLGWVMTPGELVRSPQSMVALNWPGVALGRPR